MYTNSISKLFEKILAQSNNSASIYKGISDAVSSQSQEVSVEVEDPENPESSVIIKVPSFGYLLSAIERIDNTLKTLQNVDAGSGSTVRLSDGSYRKLMLAKVPSEAPTIKNVNSITEFKFKNNWFFEDLVNPLLFATIDITGQVPANIEEVYVERYILKIQNSAQQTVFDTMFKGKSDIDYKSFLYTLIQNKMTYILDSEERKLPMRKKRFTGNFSITEIHDIQVKRTINNTEYTVNDKEYILDTFEYTDNNSDYQNSMTLSVGDEIEVINDTAISTKYQITAIDNSRLAIRVKLIQGYEELVVGENVIRMSSEKSDEVKAEIPIGYDECCVVFIKPIDPDSHIAASEFSPGTGFYTSDLTYINQSGQTETLQSFYGKYVIDVGKMLISMSKDFYPTIADGVIPNVPILQQENFRVVQINKQKNSSSSTEKMQSLIANKVQISSELETLNSKINNLNKTIQTSIFDSANSRAAVEQELNDAIDKRDSYQESFNSVINEIAALANSSTYLDEAKYHVRGFWQVPEEQVTPSGTQKIIRFKYRYRYLSLDDKSNPNDEYEYVDDQGNKKKAIYSSWVEGETNLRKRSLDTATGMYYWEDIDNLNAESIDINQIDIAITSGEKVEIQVASVSEAGYPANPLISAWSESVIIEYPSVVASSINADYIEQNKFDLITSQVNSILKSENVTKHLDSSFADNSKYFAHSADSIASGFVTAEQTPITLFEKLTSIQNDLDAIIARITDNQQEIVIDLLDSDGTVYSLKENSKTYIFAGYYKEWVDKNIEDDTAVISVTEYDENGDPKKDLCEVTIFPKAGAIMQKEYNIRIGIKSNLRLRLLSKLNGNRLSMAPNSFGKAQELASSMEYLSKPYSFRYDLYDNIAREDVIDDNYYNTKGRYDLVPINLKSSNYLDFQTASPNLFQSSQQRGQFIYARFRDVSNSFNMYANGSSNDIFDETTNRWMLNDGNGILDAESTMQRSELFGADRWALLIRKPNSGTYTLKGAAGNNIKNDTIYSFGYDEHLAASVSNDNPSWTRYSDVTGYDIDWSHLPNMYYLTHNKQDNDATSHLDNDPSIEPYFHAIYRLPRTYTYKASNMSAMSQNSLITTRVSRATKGMADRQQYLNRIAKRKVSEESLIIPRIQTTYGFGDLFNLYESSESESSENLFQQYLTTHKIGYSSEDQFMSNDNQSSETNYNTCGSYLFLSPITHTDIQVDGDSISSYKEILSTESKIYIPLIYQSRMTSYPNVNFSKDPSSDKPAPDSQGNDYIRGHILGCSSYTEYSKVVLNTIYANIIGIDIWMSNSVVRRYDIVVWSKYIRSDTDVSVTNTNISSALSDLISSNSSKSLEI